MFKKILLLGLCLFFIANCFKKNEPTQTKEETLTTKGSNINEAKLFHAPIQAGDRYGQSVAINGNYAIVGSPRDNENGSYSGSIYFYKKTSYGWVFQRKFSPADTTTNSRFGTAVAIEGNIAIASALSDSTGPGRVYIYFINSNTGQWQQFPQILRNTGTVNCFGWSVAISGKTIIVGDTYADVHWKGAAYIYESGNFGFWFKKATIIPSDLQNNDEFGYDVDISDTIAIVGARRSDAKGSNSGAAYILYRNNSGSQWASYQKLTALDGFSGDEFGTSVAITNGEGTFDYALVGAPKAYEKNYYKRDGAAYFYRRTPYGFFQIKKAVPHNSTWHDDGDFGFSVDITNNRAVVGNKTDRAWQEPISGGEAEVFNNNNGTWNYNTTLIPSDHYFYSRFGYSVGIDKNRIIVGAPFDLGSRKNSAYIFSYEYSRLFR